MVFFASDKIDLLRTATTSRGTPRRLTYYGAAITMTLHRKSNSVVLAAVAAISCHFHRGERRQKWGTQPIDILLEANINAALSHILLSLRHGVLTKVKNTGGQYRIGLALDNAINQML